MRDLRMIGDQDEYRSFIVSNFKRLESGKDRSQTLMAVFCRCFEFLVGLVPINERKGLVE